MSSFSEAPSHVPSSTIGIISPSTGRPTLHSTVSFENIPLPIDTDLDSTASHGARPNRLIHMKSYLSNMVDFELPQPITTYHPIGSVVQGNTFTVDSRYEFKDSKILGRGNGSIICNVYDVVSKEHVALKRIRPYAEDDWEAKKLLREIRIMRFLSGHKHVSLF